MTTTGAATIRCKKRGEKYNRGQQEKRKVKSEVLGVGTLNVGTMTGEGKEMAAMMQGINYDSLCAQESSRKGSKLEALEQGSSCTIMELIGREME